MQAKISSQRGAALAFSLVMLLLITLLGVNMVQQNRMQFMMAENLQNQSQTFTEAENVLQAAENFIASQRYVTWPLPNPIPASCNIGVDQHCDVYNCQTTDGVFRQLLPGELNGGSVIPDIILSNGSTVEITRTVCMENKGISEHEFDCEINADNKCFHDTLTENPPVIDPTAEGTRSGNLCETELYTITAKLVDNSNNERVIESKFAVRCDN